jgi:cobalt/nickel transport system permease protein
MLWAVHISDGVLQVPWLLGGFGVAGILVLLSLWRVRDDEVPRMALLSAAFFIVSLIHVRVGPTSVHLLFHGLIGVCSCSFSTWPTAASWPWASTPAC